MRADQPIAEVQPRVPSTSMRRLMLALGLVCTALGIIGIILPVMPGTVFLLIAAWAFSRSSERLHLWLFQHPRFGRTIREWHLYGVIPVRAKVVAITMMAGSFAYVAMTLNDNWIIPALVGATLVPVAIWIASRPGWPRA
ncbi:MAG: YbaN family protein [Alphaproteobacteria bacterium]|nr:YbaN family protein [Alphaproteobacteria bacterium]